MASAIAAEATSRIGIAPLVFNTVLRHPAVLAQETATLHLFCLGRLEVGMGAGWLRTDDAGIGAAVLRPAERVDRLAEAIEILLACWRQACVHFDGLYYQVHLDVPIADLSDIVPPRLVVGGTGRRVLELAGSKADTVSVTANLAKMLLEQAPPTALLFESFKCRTEWARASAELAGRHPEFHTLVSVCEFGLDGRRVREQLARALRRMPEDLAESPAILTGDVQEMAEHIARCRDELGITYWSVPEKSAEQFCDVVALLK